MAQENSDIHGRDIDQKSLHSMQFGEPVFPGGTVTETPGETFTGVPPQASEEQDIFLKWLAKQRPYLVDDDTLKALQELDKKRIMEEKIAELETILNSQEGEYIIYTLPNGELGARRVLKTPDTVSVLVWQKMKCPDCSADFEVAKDENGKFIYRNVVHYC